MSRCNKLNKHPTPTVPEPKQKRQEERPQVGDRTADRHFEFSSRGLACHASVHAWAACPTVLNGCGWLSTENRSNLRVCVGQIVRICYCRSVFWKVISMTYLVLFHKESWNLILVWLYVLLYFQIFQRQKHVDTYGGNFWRRKRIQENRYEDKGRGGMWN